MSTINNSDRTSHYDIQLVTSFESDSSEDSVPFGSLLLGVENTEIAPNKCVYTRTWSLPICITITGVLYLAGESWLSKIEQLLKKCRLSMHLIKAIEIPNANTVKLHFNNKLFAARMKRQLKLYIENNYNTELITITM